MIGRHSGCDLYPWNCSGIVGAYAHKVCMCMCIMCVCVCVCARAHADVRELA